MATFDYPTASTMRLVAQDVAPRLMGNRAIFNILPVREVDAPYVVWEQLDNYFGLMSPRGLNGEPQKVDPTGSKQYVVEPGVYGEWSPISEQEIVQRRAPGTYSTPINVSDLVAMRQTQLMGRLFDRLEYNGWTLITAGTYSITGPTGATLDSQSYTFQTLSGSAWSTASSGTPLHDFSLVALKAHAHGVSFGADATAYMNRKTFQYLRENTNASDIAGKRTTGLYPRVSAGGGTFNGLEEINGLLTGDDLPNIVVYDAGYLSTDGTTFANFIPDLKIVVVGKRNDGAAVGEFQMTRNASAEPAGAPGIYTKVVDKGEVAVPRTIEVHCGFNGGPAFFYPASLVVMTVT